MGVVIRLYGLNPLILMLLFIFGYFLAVTAGTVDAVKRTDFLVIHSNPEIFVLRIYGDLAIGAPFDRSAKELEDKFTSDLTVLQKNIDRQKKSGKVVLRETISPGGSDADQQNLSYLDSANL